MSTGQRLSDWLILGSNKRRTNGHRGFHGQFPGHWDSNLIISYDCYRNFPWRQVESVNFHSCPGLSFVWFKAVKSHALAVYVNSGYKSSLISTIKRPSKELSKSKAIMLTWTLNWTMHSDWSFSIKRTLGVIWVYHGKVLWSHLFLKF